MKAILELDETILKRLDNELNKKDSMKYMDIDSKRSNAVNGILRAFLKLDSNAEYYIHLLAEQEEQMILAKMFDF